MCGLCGLRPFSAGAATLDAPLGQMMDAIAHRGPDGSGRHVDPHIALGHRRLSIIDLSDASSEPMPNEDGTLWLVFNGEIYNYRELRRDLEARHPFKSHGDAEVILHLYEERGEAMVDALEGMFAFALWDQTKQRLLLARDRAGKKPLYYHAGPRLFAFASEPKALLAHPEIPRDLDPRAFPLYLTHGYVPTPGTFYASIQSLPPGHTLTVNTNGVGEPRAFWRPRFVNGVRRDEAEAALELRGLLRAAVSKRLVADVPLGAFLSGGLDSSAVVSLMAEQAQGRVRTFSIGFAGAPAYDETTHATAVARRFGTEHTTFMVEPHSLALVDDLVRHHDGPFGDSSAVPMWLLSEHTRKHVTVALTGDGGDEVFAGYTRFWGGVLSERVPRWAARAAAAAARLIPEPSDRKDRRRFLKRFAEVGALPLAERYLEWTGLFTRDLETWLRPDLAASVTRDEILQPYRTYLAKSAGGSTLSRLLQLNFETYLLDDLLVKADRTSMAHGLELRAPFLDRAVVEFGASLPDGLRMRRGKGKLLLRAAVRDLLPADILDRPKMGFGVPLGAWFRSDARTEVARRLLDPQGALSRFVRLDPVAALLREHEEGRVDASARIWALLTLESFLRQHGA